jgi:hypothetical protein
LYGNTGRPGFGKALHTYLTSCTKFTEGCRAWIAKLHMFRKMHHRKIFCIGANTNNGRDWSIKLGALVGEKWYVHAMLPKGLLAIEAGSEPFFVPSAFSPLPVKARSFSIFRAIEPTVR